MSAKHTPGPWQVSGSRLTSSPQIGRDARLLQVGPDGDILALVFFNMETGQGHQDARLIAAAPDMLDEHQQTASINIETIDRLTPEGTREILVMLVRRARAICSKVEGSQ